MDVNNMKELIIIEAINGIVKIYGIDRNVAKEIVNQSGIDHSIEIAPELVMHASIEQLVDMIIEPEEISDISNKH
ncbi:hypothetical protein [Clostridium sp. JS66]|uniref:hypothetical protein n=1 Tax=Clostridium sp. JS66 TaxID=3064705 RepID=UPI00298E36FA|nr:hypothetical protein [Clostridium sp. JS66]WPC42800.1 hypothetical protein Q6H37_04845 [Clostridium sp. JS66]